MISLWLLLLMTIVVQGQSEISTDTPSIYYTEPPILENTDTRELKELSGGRIVNGEKILDRSQSPYILREDLFVEKDGHLIIEPGVEIRFPPMIGITVRGIITAKVK